MDDWYVIECPQIGFKALGKEHLDIFEPGENGNKVPLVEWADPVQERYRYVEADAIPEGLGERDDPLTWHNDLGNWSVRPIEDDDVPALWADRQPVLKTADDLRAYLDDEWR